MCTICTLVAFHLVSSNHVPVPGHRVRLGESGRLEVVRSSPPEDAGRLRATVDAMRAAAGAGAVDVLDVSDDGDAVEVVLAYAGRSPVAPMAPLELARVGAALAAILSDLHLRGRAHGSLVVDHVLVDADGAVRLCGWGVSDAAPADDVLAFGLLLQSLLDDEHTALADAVRAVADRCCTHEPAARPTMAASAAALSGAGTPHRSIASAPRAERRRRWLPIAAAVTIAVVGGIVVALTTGSGAPAKPGVALTPSTTSTTSTTTTQVRRVWPSTPHELVANGDTWTFGGDDDLVLVGDWDCDGVATPLLLDARGAVWVIDSWPDGDEATARYVTTIPGSIDARLDGSGDCDALVITTSDGMVTPSLST
jgi:hypothetical protein